MIDNRNHNSSAISLPGILALMCGLFFLFIYWKYPAQPQFDNRGLQLLLIGVAAVMALWGLIQVGNGPVGRGRESTGRRTLPDAKGDSPGRQHESGAWRGAVVLLIGVELIYAVTTRSANRLYVMTSWVAGGAFVLGGTFEILRGSLPRKKTGGTQTRQALTAQGFVFLAMMVVMFVGSLIGRSNMLMLVFSLMAGPFVAGGWMTFTMLKRMSVRRALPRRMMAGERIWVELTVENKKRRLSSWLLDVADVIRGNGEVLRTGVLFSRVPPRDQRTGRYELRLMQRGRYTFGPLVVSTRFPLGFVERGLEFEVPDEILVYPRLGELLPAWRREQPTDTELVQSQRPQQNIYDDEFHRMREYRWGDNPRAIHWRTSARRNELMVREYHQTRQQNLTILLDLWLPENAGDDDWERVEMAVSFAATLGVDHMRDSRDSVITLFTAGRKDRRWEGQSGPASFDSYLESLAVIQPALEPNTGWLEENLVAHSSLDSRTLVITSREPVAAPGGEEAASRHWFEQYPQCETVMVGRKDLSRYFVIEA